MPTVCVGAGAVALQAEHELLVLRLRGAGRQRQRASRDGCGAANVVLLDIVVSSFGFVAADTQYENGQTRK